MLRLNYSRWGLFKLKFLTFRFVKMKFLNLNLFKLKLFTLKFLKFRLLKLHLLKLSGPVFVLVLVLSCLVSSRLVLS